MTDTADTTTLSADERAASARGFFDVDPLAGGVFPPPPPAVPTLAVPLVTAPGIPQLPTIAPPAPSQATPFAFSPSGPGPTGPPPKPHSKRKGGGARRFISWLIVLAVVGGGVYAAITYGPELMNRTEDDPTASEPDAPLVFPPVVPVAVPTRTANFVVEQPADNGTTVRYEVTNDFETGVSRLLVDRATVSDIEVLAVFDVAYVHEVDQPNWWSLPRGGFPLAGGPERQRWLRTVDEYFPEAMRSFITIDGASESMTGTEPTRHLVVTVDVSGLAASATAVIALGLLAQIAGRSVEPAADAPRPPASSILVTAQPGETVWEVAVRVAPGRSGPEVAALAERIAVENALSSARLGSGQVLRVPPDDEHRAAGQSAHHPHDTPSP
jgi:hypothetical protein